MDVVKSMKIIIADAKSLKEKHFPIEKQTPLFFNKAESLRKQLKELDIDQIHDLMKISFKQSSLIYDYFHNEETFAAINLFNGVVFKQLDLKNYQKEEWDYLDKHLLINSPLYGILRYNDAVNYHRLEMKHKLNEINLYQYWYKELNDYLKNEDVILSLSTKEYEKMFDLPIIQLDFVIRNGHTFKRNAVYLKKARGMILNYLIEHHIEDIEQIKEIVIDDYHFSEDDSNDDHWVFIKNEKMKYIQEASQKYGELLNNIILVLVRKRCTVSEFYMEIWNNFAKLPLLNEQESKGIILLLLCLTPCIPYYAPKNLMSLKEEEYAKYRDQVLGLIIKSKSVIFQPLEQRSERASALLELLDQCASMEEKVVLMSYILAIIEQLREKSTAS